MKAIKNHGKQTKTGSVPKELTRRDETYKIKQYNLKDLCEHKQHF